MTNDRLTRIRERLETALDADILNIEDHSHRHRNHPGAADGRGHFVVELVSPQFVDLNTIARHRLVYDALSDLLETDIHALSIRAHAPEPGAPTRRGTS